MSFSFVWEMSWKSAGIIALALGLAALLRARGPGERAAVLRLGVGLLLAMPVIALLLPALRIETAAEPIAALPIEAFATAAPLEIAALQPVPSSLWDDPSAPIAILYLGGLFAVLLRIGVGLSLLHRWTRGAAPVSDPAWLAAMDRMWPAGSRVRLLVSDVCNAPLSWGWLRPAILLDRATLERREDADAVLAHELAHIARRDWPALMMTRATVALFWFNPLAWLLERELVQQAEEAADLEALARVEPTHYAQTLVACARHGRTALVPANSMAPRASGLRRRVHAILERRAAASSGSFWTAAAMLGCAGFAAPLAAIELVPAMAELVQAPVAPRPLASILPTAAPAAPVTPAALSTRLEPAVRAAPIPPRPVAPLASPDEVIEVPAIDIDVPETRVHVPAIKMDVDGIRVDVPEMNVVAPRVRVNVPPIRVRMPQIAAASVAGAHAVAGVQMHGWSAEDRAEFERDMREARRELAEARAEARAEADADSLQRIAEARREAARERHRERRAIRVDLSGAAKSMEQGAREMDEAASKLRDPEYREEQIARARRKGETVTHRELIDAIPKLRAGADNMRESAERMRQRGH